MPAQTTSRVTSLKNVATRLRIDSIRATSEAGSGHPTSCCSAAEIVSALFFAEMRYDPRDPKNPHNDRFVLSKGHAAPVLYAAWAEAGIIPRDELLTLRRIDSDLEGHPTPRLPWVAVATGSPPTTAPTSSSAMARAPKDRCGRPPKRRHFTPSTRSAPSSTSMRSARASRRSGSTI